MRTNLLAQLIDRKQEVLTQLWQLARRQVGLVEQCDMGGLLGLLAAKQKLLAILQHLEGQLDVFRDDDPDQRVWSSTAFRERTRKTAERCQVLLGDIVRVEHQCETELIQRRDSAGTRLQGAHAASQARQAYARSDLTRSGQLDLSSET